MYRGLNLRLRVGKSIMPERKNFLVAIVSRLSDFVIARDQNWYRIPVESVEKWLQDRWPPEGLAFYQTKVFKEEAFGIYYSCRVLKVRRVQRRELFPDLLDDPKASRFYYQLMLSPLERLPRPIPSLRRRRIVFIPTTREKFFGANEINDLYDSSPLEDRLWVELRRRRIPAERQVFITANGRKYALDFAVYCIRGNIAIEADGDAWHSDPKRIPLDNRRDNDLETSGWKLLRFNSLHLKEQMADYCLPTIIKNVKNLGGSYGARLSGAK